MLCLIIHICTKMQSNSYRYNYLLRISYNGKNFYGVVPQRNLRTVLDELAKLLDIDKYRYSIVSRTDKGVSAEENYVVISTDKEIKIRSSDEIKILKVYKLSEFINIRKFSQGKLYYYYLQKNPDFYYKPKYLIIDDNKIEIKWKEDIFSIERYIEGAKKFIGKKSFHNFAKGKVKDPICNIRKFHIIDEGNYYINIIEGNRFLYEMIRRIISFLVSVGKGMFPLDKLDLVFIGKLDPKPFPAPPENLLLKKVYLDWKNLYKYIEYVLL